MIHFKTLELKNFISVGDEPIVIQIDRSPTTLVTGENGTGKSAITVDGITFALFGRSFRGVTRGQLINTTNQKDSYAKITFTARGSDYVIMRGQKPARLEIYKDGGLLNEDAAVRDSQDALERDVLGFDYNTFIRVSILSTMNHVPFMQLSAYERRNFVENMLSLKAYADMNKIHRANVSLIKNEFADLDKSINILDATIREKESTLELLRDIDAAQVERTKAEALDIIQQLESNKNKIMDITKSTQLLLEQSAGTNSAKTLVRKLERDIASLETERKLINARKVKLLTSDDCDTCLQDISVGAKRNISDTFEEQLATLDGRINGDLTKELESATRILDDSQHAATAFNNLQIELHQLTQYGDNLKRELKRKVSESSTRDESKIVDVLSDIKSLKREMKENADAFDECKQRLFIMTTVNDILKDTGIKASIIKQYIPMLVGYVNYYLGKLNIHATFAMDENFTDSISTQYAKEYTYANLSAGERARIDLAISFAWRQISKIKGSAYCNLLVLDEIADASLDINGTEDLMLILSELEEDTNVFIISHKGNIEEHCRATLSLEKQNGFTRIVK